MLNDCSSWWLGHVVRKFWRDFSWRRIQLSIKHEKNNKVFRRCEFFIMCLINENWTVTKLFQSEIWKALLQGLGQAKPWIFYLLFHSIFMNQMFLLPLLWFYLALYILAPALCIPLVRFLFSSYPAVNNALYTALYRHILDLAEGETEMLNGI